MSAKRRCDVPGCERERLYKDYCSAHHQQILRRGRILDRPVRRVNVSLAERFEELTTPEPTTGCLLWLGQLNSEGRPRLRLGDKWVNAARFALGIHERPRSVQANHKCMTAQCVNPDHLYAGTQKENIADMVRAKRGHWQVGS